MAKKVTGYRMIRIALQAYNFSILNGRDDPAGVGTISITSGPMIVNSSSHVYEKLHDALCHENCREA